MKALFQWRIYFCHVPIRERKAGASLAVYLLILAERENAALFEHRNAHLIMEISWHRNNAQLINAPAIADEIFGSVVGVGSALGCGST